MGERSPLKVIELNMINKMFQVVMLFIILSEKFSIIYIASGKFLF